MTLSSVPLIDDSEILAACRSVSSIPDFPTVDELNSAMEKIAADSSGVASLRRIGTSRLGEPLMSLTIEGGERNAVVYAGVHPNEPVGFRTALHLAGQMVRDDSLRRRLGYTWHIVGCLDPDAARLNEGWYKGPFTHSNYGRHFYRPVESAQPEWAFPLDHKRAYFDRMLPESVALMRLIDEVQPRVLCSLHNAEAGGVFFYLSDASEQLQQVLLKLPGVVGVPLDLGLPESQAATVLAPGIYQSVTSQQEYDFLESIGLDPLVGEPAGSNASDYATSRYDTRTLVVEVPQWAISGVDDVSAGNVRYDVMVRRQADAVRDLCRILTGHLDSVSDDLRVTSPFHDVARYHVRSLPSRIKHVSAENSRRQATVAEQATAMNLVHMYRMRCGGSLLRMLDAEIAAGNVTSAIRKSRELLAAEFTLWGAEADLQMDLPHIPIESVVGIQYAAILATAASAAPEVS